MCWPQVLGRNLSQLRPGRRRHPRADHRRQQAQHALRDALHHAAGGCWGQRDQPQVQSRNVFSSLSSSDEEFIAPEPLLSQSRNPFCLGAGALVVSAVCGLTGSVCETHVLTGTLVLSLSQHGGVLRAGVGQRHSDGDASRRGGGRGLAAAAGGWGGGGGACAEAGERAQRGAGDGRDREDAMRPAVSRGFESIWPKD